MNEQSIHVVSHYNVNYITCCFCGRNFGGRNNKGYRNAILLSCGHTTCDSCLHGLKSKSSQCKICGCDIKIDSAQSASGLRQNAYVHGRFFLQSKFITSHNDLTYISSLSKYKTCKKSIESVNSILCCECSNCQATLSCQQCSSNFCEKCWEKVHFYSKVLSKHIPVILYSEYGKLVPCFEHKVQMMEFFCKGCNKYVCPYCVILYHQGEGHKPIPIKEKNCELLGIFRVLKLELKEKVANMMAMSKDLKSRKDVTVSPENVNRFADVKKEIVSKFMHLHGVLQVMEESLLDSVEEAESRSVANLNNVLAQLEDQIAFSRNVVTEIEKAEVSKQFYSQMFLQPLLASAEKAKSFPTELHEINNEEEDSPGVSVTFDSSIVDSIKNFCTLTIPKTKMFELRTSYERLSSSPSSNLSIPLTKTDESEEENENENVDVVNKEEIVEINRRIRSDGNGTWFEEVSRSECNKKTKWKLLKPFSNQPSNVKYPVQNSLHANETAFSEGQAYNVNLSYVKDPGEFYVIKSSNKEKQLVIDKKSRIFAEGSSRIPKKVLKDQWYLVQYAADMKWYRGRVVEVLSESENQNLETLVLIYYLDYGNRQEVPISKLREMPKELHDKPPLAVKCKLFSCIPKSGKWSKEATKTMLTMLKKSCLTMYVMRVSVDVLEVDLSSFCEDIMDKEITSFRESMVFLDHADLVGGCKKKAAKSSHLNYLNPILPEVGQSFDGVITHIESPSCLFIQKVNADAEYLFKLMGGLNSDYNENDQKGLIYNPAIGMPCAAIYPEDRKWYRGKIIDLPGNKMITVLYVDYGNEETVPWKLVRKLRPEYLKLACQGLRSSLSKIMPTKNVEWKPDAKSYLETHCRGLLKVYVNNCDNETLKVVLYNNSNREKICINVELLIEKALDKSDEEASVLSLSNSSDQEYNNSSNDYDSTVKSLYSPFSSASNDNEDADQRAEKKQTLSKECKKRKFSNGSSSIGTKKQADQQPTNSDCTTDGDDIFRTAVKILRVTSPSDIYVSVLFFASKLMEMEAALETFYRSSNVDQNLKLGLNNKCAVFSEEKGRWYRATVLEILDDNKYKVYLKDVAETEEVSISHIRKLDESFFHYPVGAIKCHLAGIFPPETEWPGITCDFLKNELEENKNVYMTKMGDIVNNSLPIQLMVKKTVHGGALEPSIETLFVLNDLIVEQGLAVPEKAKLLHHLCEEPKDIKPNERDHSPNLDLDIKSEVSHMDINSTFNCKEAEVKLEQSKSSEIEEEEDNDNYESNANDNDVEDGNEDDDDDDDDDGDNVFVPPVSADWMHPQLGANTKFIGLPTYVDDNGVIYMHDIQEDAPQLQMIRNTLMEEYGNSKPKPRDCYWSVDQLCIAKFYLDNCWYRGKIVKINDDLTYEVLFVDYGNTETCSVSDIRKNIKFLNVPILARRYVLHGISPVSANGKWSKKAIDYMHVLIVDNTCNVTIVERAEDSKEPSGVILQLCIDSINVADNLVKKKLAKYFLKNTIKKDCTLKNKTDKYLQCSENISFEKTDHSLKEESLFLNSMHSILSDSYLSVKSSYSSLDIPGNCSTFPIDVMTVMANSRFNAHILDHEFLPVEMKLMILEFGKLSEEIQKLAPQQECLSDIVEGEPCVCLYAENGQWYRAEIKKLHDTSDFVPIHYVDYGNSENVSRDRIRRCLPDWFRVPRMSINFTLFNVQRNPAADKSLFVDRLTMCLSDCEPVVDIKRKRKDIYEVHVFSKGSTTLAYQQMIDEGLMEVIEEC